MVRTQLDGKWSREPIFPCTGAAKPDGTSFAYFSHLFYDGELVQTAYAEEIGDGLWEARVVEGYGEHRMSSTYASMHEAMEDVIGWTTGQ